ncbi:hypothetical protein F511_05784 [Dorcoceras hygrometricum]|uniref:Uncharacterized protein n=1 Tax=Dorcoceras hygrometricum TaxID=472368 RepID=A0A2Z7B521_9LAMI|nr:hypothetical protein F511_05784 [Dorcoceras hygrometricum]
MKPYLKGQLTLSTAAHPSVVKGKLTLSTAAHPSMMIETDLVVELVLQHHERHPKAPVPIKPEKKSRFDQHRRFLGVKSRRRHSPEGRTSYSYHKLESVSSVVLKSTISSLKHAREF